MRKLTDVINQILKVSTNEELNNKLQQIKSDIRFTAPELMYMRWNLTHEALESHTLNPIDDEMVKVFSIFSTKTEDEIREIFNN